MPKFTLDGLQARVFLACVNVGAEGVDADFDERVMDAVRSGVIDGDAVTYQFEGELFEEVKSAFTVGWEGFEPGNDTERLQARAGDQVADILGIAPLAPAP